LKYRSVFDIIGPIMIGPSSSHTAGAVRIGKMARNLFGKEPKWAKIHFYGSFASTYRGHGTDVAIVGGLLDLNTFDETIIDAINIANNTGIHLDFFIDESIPDHPNTARIELGDDQEKLEMIGISIGGGKIEIIELNGFKLNLSGSGPALLVEHHDRFGAIASVSEILAKYKINIGHMEVSRKDIGQLSLMSIEIDQNVDDEIISEITKLPTIIKVTKIIA
jgi:L-serine dehydratase